MKLETRHPAALRWHPRWRRFSPWAWLATVLAAFALGIVLRDRLPPHQFSERLGLRTEFVGVLRGLVTRPSTALSGLFNPPALPTLVIDMGAEHVRRIEEKRREALELGVLFSAGDDDLVPARIRLENETVRVRMRLKGDLSDHWDGDKWSYRVEVRDEDVLFGMRRFSLQHPKTRNFLAEWVWLNTLRLDGVLAPRYDFVRVVFNGADKGIYALEEFFSPELLESQGRRDGVVVAFDEGLFWQRFAQLDRSPSDYDSLLAALPDLFRHPVIAMRETRVAADPVLSDQRDAAVGLIRGLQEGRLRPSDVFEARQLSRFLALSELWEARHALLNSSLHLYLDPLTARLEPIGFDGNAQETRTEGLYALARPWVREFLEDPEFARLFVEELERASAPEYLARLRTALAPTLSDFGRALFREFPQASDVDALWTGFERRQREIQRLLDVPQLARAWFVDDPEGATAGSRVRLSIRNSTALPIEILAIHNGRERVDASTLSPHASTAHSERHFPLLHASRSGAAAGSDAAVLDVPVHLIAEENVDVLVEARLLGRAAVATIPVERAPPLLSTTPVPRWPSVDEVLARHPFLTQTASSDGLSVRPGDWHVEGDLVVPKGLPLALEPGTVLRFGPGAILLASGPVHARGSADAPVSFLPAAGTWGGIVVLDAAEPSVWDHVRIGHTAGIARPGWHLTGAVTFYRSTLHMSHADLYGSLAEDAVNVVQGAFRFTDCLFRSTASDAFDADFSDGLIERCEFRDIGNDAVDVSGSDVGVYHTTVRGAGDKAFSIGENSRFDGSDLVIADVRLGIAGKDRSTVQAANVTIERAWLSALAGYQKKAEFGPARIVGRGIRIRETATPTLVATGSTVVLDDREIEGTADELEILMRAGVFED